MPDIAFRVKNGLVVNGSLLVANTSTNRVGVLSSSPTVTLDLGTATDAIMLPVGNTGQRSVGANGHIRYNSQLATFEGFANSAWGPIAGTANTAPPGSNTEIIFNDGATANTSAGFTYNKASNNVIIANTLSVGTAVINSTSTTLSGLTSNSTVWTIVGTAVINSTSYTIGSTIVRSGSIALGGGASVNTTSFVVGNSTLSSVGGLTLGTGVSGSIQFATGATINSTSYSGQSSTSLTANNSTYLGGQLPAYYLALGNATGSITSGQLGTSLLPQFSSVGVGVAAPGSNGLNVYGNVFTYSSLLAAGNVIGGYSDIRFKTDFEQIMSPMNKIVAIRACTYVPNELARSFGFGTDREVGVIAQDVHKVLPEAVKLAPVDIDQSTGKSISGENYLTVQYEKLVPLLIEGMKELLTRIEVLEKERR